MTFRKARASGLSYHMKPEDVRMHTVGIFGLASQQAKWLSTRQQVVAENISHANLPGYKTRDLESFEAVLSRGGPAMAVTDAKHVSSYRTKDGLKRLEAGSTSDGKVSVEAELMKSTEIRNGLEMNTALVRAFHRMILTVVKG